MSFFLAKTWGNEKDEIVLVCHGIMTNAGSFDGLIPLLPSNFYYVCIDLPGHGKSSHFPPFFLIHSLDYILVYKLLVRYFKKNSYIFLGHSFGALNAQLFSRLYPQYVKKLIMIDVVISEPIETDTFKDYLLRAIDTVMKIHDRSSQSSSQPKYTYEEALDRIQNSHWGDPLPKEPAISLLNRFIEPFGKYTLMNFPKNIDLMKPFRDEISCEL